LRGRDGVTTVGKQEEIMKPFDLKSLATGAIVGAATIFVIAAASPQRVPMEYAVVPGIVHSGELQAKMNKYSADEWEFVAIESIGDKYGYALFKRPKP
jgi:hypothetical protein